MNVYTQPCYYYEDQTENLFHILLLLTFRFIETNSKRETFYLIRHAINRLTNFMIARIRTFNIRLQPYLTTLQWVELDSSLRDIKEINIAKASNGIEISPGRNTWLLNGLAFIMKSCSANKFLSKI